MTSFVLLLFRFHMSYTRKPKILVSNSSGVLHAEVQKLTKRTRERKREEKARVESSMKSLLQIDFQWRNQQTELVFYLFIYYYCYLFFVRYTNWAWAITKVRLLQTKFRCFICWLFRLLAEKLKKKPSLVRSESGGGWRKRTGPELKDLYAPIKLRA